MGRTVRLLLALLLLPLWPPTAGAEPGADRKIVYGRVMEVMGTVNAAGFTRVALIAELPKPGESSEDEGGGGG